MQFNVTLDDQTTALTVTRDEDGRLAIATPDRETAVTCRRIDDHHLFLTIDGKGCNAFVSGDGHTRQIVIDGAPCAVSDADEAARYAPAGAAARTLPREVTPPMPAVVVKIMVAADQQVRQGEPLVVVSAMKMETSLTAPYDARVVRINTAVGDKVMPGDILVDLEAVETDPPPED